MATTSFAGYDVGADTGVLEVDKVGVDGAYELALELHVVHTYEQRHPLLAWWTDDRGTCLRVAEVGSA
jgi:hypothetical protein